MKRETHVSNQKTKVNVVPGIQLNRALAVAATSDEVILLYEDSEGALRAASSADGLHFKARRGARPALKTSSGKILPPANLSALRITELTPHEYVMTGSLRAGRSKKLFVALSKSLGQWSRGHAVSAISETGVVVPEFLLRGERIMYTGENTLRLARSKNLVSWKLERGVVLKPRPKFYDEGGLEPLQVFHQPEGIFLLYLARSSADGAWALGGALLDRDNPQEVLWRTDVPLWEQSGEWSGKRMQPVGAVSFAKKLIAYWQTEGTVTALVLTTKDLHRRFFAQKSPALSRFAGNPIIEPDPEHPWESKATFNPAALYEAGKMHLVYRAIGDNDVSVLGYASSRDGVHINERLPHPMYVPREPFEGAKKKTHAATPYSYSPYLSGGGGAGGCEDPRLAKIGNRIYMTYVAYDGGSEPRVALTSIAVEDFLAKRWNWARPVLISRPGQVNKNACIVPEQAQGKYAVLHRVFPNILVDFVDDLNFDGNRFLEAKAVIPVRNFYWDSRKLGAGATPIKTREGWLLIYQGVDDRDSGRYKVGAMLLDLEDPSVVLCRTRYPVLEPEEHYENNGHKYGVVYPCGAAVVEGQLFVYYGAADRVTCVATTPLDKFVRQLKNHRNPKLQPVTVLA